MEGPEGMETVMAIHTTTDLKRIRELVKLVLEDEADRTDTYELAERFNTLDNRLSKGDPLPKDWRR
jgi:hypothetical protein